MPKEIIPLKNPIYIDPKYSYLDFLGNPKKESPRLPSPHEGFALTGGKKTELEERIKQATGIDAIYEFQQGPNTAIRITLLTAPETGEIREQCGIMEVKKRFNLTGKPLILTSVDILRGTVLVNQDARAANAQSSFRLTFVPYITQNPPYELNTPFPSPLR